MKKHNDQKLKDVLKDMVNSYKLKPKLNQAKVRNLWETLMGPSITRYTKEIYIRKKKLFVTLDSSPVKQELSMGKEKIRKIINEELGEDYLEEVVIR